jgi:hypothetical protein
MGPVKSKRIKTCVFAVFTVIATVSACLLGLELIMRIVYFQPKGRAAVPYEYRLSELKGVQYELTPGHTFQWKYGARKLFDRGFSIPVRINAHGYRGREVMDPVPDDHFRILAVGDSFTLGLGVREEDTWVIQLENLLKTESTSIPAKQYASIEIINAGTGSWNTQTEYQYLRQKGMTHNPDAVILGFFVNDFRVDDSAEYMITETGHLKRKHGGKRSTELQSVLYEDSTSKNWRDTLVESSHLIRWISGRNMIFQTQALMASYGTHEKERVYTAVRGIHAITQNAGIPFYMCLFAHVEDTVSPPDDRALNELADVCRSLDIPVLRMDEALKGFKAADLWVHPKDRHPNAIAHSFYAQHIFSHFFSGE